jgi:transcriptional regulator with XRE-family HTH domain
VDDRQVGSALRAVRGKRRLTQAEVAQRAGTSQSTVCRLERGSIESVGLGTARRIAAAIGVSLSVTAWWRGGELARLLDARHARLVELVIRELRRNAWDVLTEYTFSQYGERGSVDIVAWHATTRTVLVVEVKSRLADLQDLVSTLDRKVRLVPILLARDRGWHAENVGRAVVIAATTTNRDVVAAHSATFASALPAGTIRVRRWLESPNGGISGRWFLRELHSTNGAERQRPAKTQARKRPAESDRATAADERARARVTA